MDLNFWTEFFKLLIILPFIVVLIYITFKYGGKYMSKMNGSKLIKIHERVALSQKTFLSVVSIAGKFYLMSGSDKGAEILMELDKDAVSEYEAVKSEKNEDALSLVLNRLKGKVKNEKI